MALALMVVLLTLIGGRLVPILQGFLGGEGRERNLRDSRIRYGCDWAGDGGGLLVSPRTAGWILLAAGVMQVARFAALVRVAHLA